MECVKNNVTYILFAQDTDRWLAFVNAVMNFRVSQNAGNFLTSREPISFPRKALFCGVRKGVR